MNGFRLFFESLFCYVREFSLRLPEATGTLTFSFIGYKTLHIPFTADVPLFRMI